MVPVLKYLSVSEMVAIEKEADSGGWTYAQMMEQAGQGLADVVHHEFGYLREYGVLGLAGSGNNGGDTLVALALLARRGWRAAAYLVRPRPADDPLVERLRHVGGEVVSAGDDEEYVRLNTLLEEHHGILDGVLGTGIRLPLKPELAQVLAHVKSYKSNHSETWVVAVDCPSGVDCDSGAAASETIPADLTVTMAAAKRGLLMLPAFEYVGELRGIGIGLGTHAPVPKALAKIRRFVPERNWVHSVLPARPANAHKGTFGAALIAAGSMNFTGAAYLAGAAAYRVGAGLVTLAIPEPLHAILAGRLPEATWILLPEADGGIAERGADVLRQNLGRATALLVGPGFGLAESARRFWPRLLGGVPAAPGRAMGFSTLQAGASGAGSLPPMVVDADGLKLLVKMEDWARKLPAPAVLTPHPGEMSILTGSSTSEIQSNRIAVAERFAKEWGHVVVLKGAFSVIASPGGDTAIIPAASAALARAGTGDVLAGVIVGLLAQGLAPFEAAVAGAWLHAQAGLVEARRQGNTASVLAGDLLGGLVRVLASLS